MMSSKGTLAVLVSLILSYTFVVRAEEAGVSDQTEQVQKRDVAAINGVELPTTSVISTDSARNWKGQILNEIYVNEGELRDKSSDAKITSYTEPKLSYKATENTYLEVSVPFEVNSVPDKAEKADSVQQEVGEGKVFEGTRLSNVWLGLSSKKGHVFGSDDIVTWLRYYLPTCEASREQKLNGVIRLDVQVPWTVDKWNFLYLLTPRLTLSHDENTDRESHLSFRQYGIVTYSFSDSFSFYTSYGAKLESNSRNFLFNNQVVHAFESGATYTFNPTINVTFYVTDEYVQGTDDIKLFAPEKNNMTLATVINF